MAELFNMNSVYPLIQSLYGIDSGTDFEDIALNGWELIGNKHTRLYRYKSPTKDKKLELPCNVDIIESVQIPIADAQYTSNHKNFEDYENIWVEEYIDRMNETSSPFNTKGKLIKYTEGENTLFFTKDYPEVNILYKGVLVDDENGLPMINAKEMRAIAAFVAYTESYKDAIKKKDQVSLRYILPQMQQEWLRRCNAARIKDYLTQNDMNDILDARSRWDRKQFGKSLHPLI